MHARRSTVRGLNNWVGGDIFDVIALTCVDGVQVAPSTGGDAQKRDPGADRIIA